MVQLKGIGYNGPEPLHVLILADNSVSLEKAKSLTQNLLDTIESHYNEFMLYGSWSYSNQMNP